MVLRRIGLFVLELAIVAAAVVAGSWMAAQVRIIPKAILHLPEIQFSTDDTLSVLRAFLGFCALAFAANSLINGWDVFASPRRAAKEIYALVAGIVAAALYLFLLTAINFSPELLLDATLIAILLFTVAVAAFRAQPGRFWGQLFALLKSPWTWPILLFALSPILVARQFTADRDFANWVTNIRVSANLGGDHPYELVNALGSARFLTPIDIKFAKGDPSHIYILSRTGQLHRADYPSGANPVLLLDLAHKVGYVEMENGALGFDLHPDFGKTGATGAGQVFVYYTEYHADHQVNHLTRYDLNAGDPAKVLASATSLFEQRRGNDGFHNAGTVMFGPDGFLYVSVGEASMTECWQRVDCALVGGILRLDVDQRGGTVSRAIAKQPKDGRSANYYIPLDNPYAGDPKALGEFWASGLRNPFRISFDPATGQLWAGDVGTTVWEEVDRIEKGGNYQFPYVEGHEKQTMLEGRAALADAPMPVEPGKQFGPIYTYRHTAYLRSVIGGLVYRADRLPALKGKYVFMDNYSGQIGTIPIDRAQVDKWTVIARSHEVAQRGVTAFAVAPDGNLLMTVMGDNDKPTGIVAKLVPSDSDEAAAARTERAAAVPSVAKITPQQAQTLFNVNCSRCHGAGGKGDGPDSQRLGDYVPNFTDPNFQRWRSDEEILAVLKGGGMAVGRGPAMPPWEGILSDAEMVALKDHVRSLKAK